MGGSMVRALGTWHASQSAEVPSFKGVGTPGNPVTREHVGDLFRYLNEVKGKVPELGDQTGNQQLLDQARQLAQRSAQPNATSSALAVDVDYFSLAVGAGYSGSHYSLATVKNWERVSWKNVDRLFSSDGVLGKFRVIRLRETGQVGSQELDGERRIYVTEGVAKMLEKRLLRVAIEQKRTDGPFEWIPNGRVKAEVNSIGDRVEEFVREELVPQLNKKRKAERAALEVTRLQAEEEKRKARLGESRSAANAGPSDGKKPNALADWLRNSIGF